MKNRYIIQFLILFLSIIYYSCNDILSDSYVFKEDKELFSISEAQIYFEDNATDLRPISLSRTIDTRSDGASPVELIPDWGRAKCERNSNVILYQIPLRSISVAQVRARVFKNNNMVYQYFPESERRLVVAQRNTGKIEMFVITIIPEIKDTRYDSRSMLDEYTFLSSDNSFNGKVFLSDLSGVFLKAFGYTDGRKNGQLSTRLRKNEVSSDDVLRHNHEDKTDVLMRISFMESRVVMTRAGGGEYYVADSIGSGINCSICGKPIDYCECEIEVTACRYCGKIEGCECEKCSQCGYRVSECMCICSLCSFNIKDCKCDKINIDDIGDYEDGSSVGGSGGSGQDLAKSIFRNSELSEDQWNEIGLLLDKIVSTCMGGNLYNKLKEKMNGNTFYISIDSNSNNGSFGFGGDSGAYIKLGNQLDDGQLLHEMMHALHAYNETPETFENSMMNTEIEARYSQYLYYKKSNQFQDGLGKSQLMKRIKLSIVELENVLDSKGNLKENVPIEELKRILYNAEAELRTIPAYSILNYDNSRDNLLTFKNLQIITSDCP